MIINDAGEYIITYTADDIRKACGRELSIEECDELAEAIGNWFDDEFEENCTLFGRER